MAVLDSYVDRYGQDAALVTSVVALAQRGELFDRSQDDTGIVKSYFHRVPNSNLIVNRVDTNDQYGESRTFTVLNGDESLFQIGDSGQLEFNNLTLSQVETLQAAQREGANPLLVSESFFQVDVGQGLTNDGQVQARAILSQGDVITPDMVTVLNNLMAAEEDIRRSDQAARGLVGEVSYPRFTEQELNRNLATDTIARQLSALSPVVEVQSVTQPQAVTEPLQQPGNTVPNVYDRPQAEIQRMETLALTLLQSGETLVAPATFTADGAPLLPPMQLSLSDQVGSDGLRLLERFYPDTNYSPGQRSLHTAEVLGGDGILQAMQDGTLETADRQLVRVPDLLPWEQLQAPALNLVEGEGYVLSVDAERAYRTQWAAASNLPLPELSAAIPAIPGYESGIPTLRQLLDGQQVLLDRELAAQQLQSASVQDAPSVQSLTPEQLSTLTDQVQSLANQAPFSFEEKYGDYPDETIESAYAYALPGSPLVVERYESQSRWGGEVTAVGCSINIPNLADPTDPYAEPEARLFSMNATGEIKFNHLTPEHLATIAQAVQEQPDYVAMTDLAMSLLVSDETLVVPTQEGNAVVSLEGGYKTLVKVQSADGVETSDLHPSRAFQPSGLFEAMSNGTLTTADGQRVTLPNLDQERPQAEVQEPSAPANGQRETAPQTPAPVAPKVQPPIPKPKEVTMTVVEAPAPVELKPIQLDDMLSEFSKDAMRGITGTRNTYNPSTQSRGTEERSPGETFAKFAKGAYGIENFCKDNGIPFQGSADYLVNKTALELDISPEFKAEVLSGIKREECVAPVILATESEAAAWKRVYELQPETFAAIASPVMHDTIMLDASVIAQAQSKALAALGLTLSTAEPTRDPAKLGYEPAPSTPETAELIAFRDSLSASQLREWATAVQVNEPQNTDKQKWVADFTAKFQKSGYEMSDGGMSVGMAKRLTEVQQQMEPDVAKLRTEMAATINQMLNQAPNVEGKDYKKLDAQSLGLTIKGREGNFEAKGQTGKLLMLAKDGEVTINRLPATVVSRMSGMVDMQQKMQQATVQRTVSAPTKKGAELTA